MRVIFTCTDLQHCTKRNMMSYNRQLYPEIDPFARGWLKVSDLHQIYYEQSGNKEGKPVVFMLVLYH